MPVCHTFCVTSSDIELLVKTYCIAPNAILLVFLFCNIYGIFSLLFASLHKFFTFVKL